MVKGYGSLGDAEFVGMKLPVSRHETTSLSVGNPCFVGTKLQLGPPFPRCQCKGTTSFVGNCARWRSFALFGEQFLRFAEIFDDEFDLLAQHPAQVAR